VITRLTLAARLKVGAPEIPPPISHVGSRRRTLLDSVIEIPQSAFPR